MKKVKTNEAVQKAVDKYLEFCIANGFPTESDLACEMLKCDFKLFCYAQITGKDFEKVMDGCVEARTAYLQSLKSN